MGPDHGRRARAAYLDGELDALGAARFERHLAACARCQAALSGDRAVRAALGDAGLYAPATAGLRSRIGRALDAEAKGRPARAPALRRQAPWWAGLAAALALGVAAGALVFPGLGRPKGEAAMASQVVDAHVRSLQPGHLTDVASTDRHTVKPWFAGRIDFAPPVEDLAAEGFPLTGGRLDVIGGRPVAALAYARRQHVINVFVWPGTPAESGPDTGTLRGYSWRRFAARGMTFWAVTDAAPADLEALARALTR